MTSFSHSMSDSLSWRPKYYTLHAFSIENIARNDHDSGDHLVCVKRGENFRGIREDELLAETHWRERGWAWQYRELQYGEGGAFFILIIVKWNIQPASIITYTDIFLTTELASAMTRPCLCGPCCVLIKQPTCFLTVVFPALRLSKTEVINLSEQWSIVILFGIEPMLHFTIWWGNDNEIR